LLYDKVWKFDIKNIYPKNIKVYTDIDPTVDFVFPSTFLFVWFLDESWDHAVWYYSIEPITIIKKKKTKKKLMLIYEITILNIALINFIIIVKLLLIIILFKKIALW
jgi:hypothetical protein